LFGEDKILRVSKDPRVGRGFPMRIFISIVALHIALAFPSICAGDWSTPVNLGPVVNSDSSDARPEISRDESSLFFQSNREGGHGGSDLWVSRAYEGEWSVPLNLGATVNSAFHEIGPSLSASGDTLYFSSDRPGGQGGFDIWMSVMERDSWSDPVNMGPVMNSSSHEEGPEITDDGKRLYFHSDRPGGYGQRDIWFSERSAGIWEFLSIPGQG
jgi:Tol biopolymer transport system component